jgi:hypothetical protein
MTIDYHCEECGVPATRTLHGIDLCDHCEIGGEEDCEPPHWANEVPSGLFDDEADEFGAPVG